MGVEYFKCSDPECDEVICDHGDYIRCEECSNCYCCEECSVMRSQRTGVGKKYICYNCLPKCVCCNEKIYEIVIFCDQCKKIYCEKCSLYIETYNTVIDETKEPNLYNESICITNCLWCGEKRDFIKNVDCEICWDDELVVQSYELHHNCISNLCYVHYLLHKCGYRCGLDDRRKKFIQNNENEIKNHLLEKLLSDKYFDEMIKYCLDFNNLPK